MKNTFGSFALLAIMAAILSGTSTTPLTQGPQVPAEIQALLDKHGCAACHSMERKLVGPKWPDIAQKKYSAKRIAELVKKPEPANWPGYVPMLAQTNIPKAELMKIANWLAKMP